MKKNVGIINDTYVPMDENNMTSSDNTSAVGWAIGYGQRTYQIIRMIFIPRALGTEYSNGRIHRRLLTENMDDRHPQ